MTESTVPLLVVRTYLLYDVAKVQEYNEQEKAIYSNQNMHITQTYRNILFKVPTDSYAVMKIVDGEQYILSISATRPCRKLYRCVSLSPLCGICPGRKQIF